MAHFSFGINKKHSRSDFSQNPPFSSIMNVCQFGWVDFFFFFWGGGGQDGPKNMFLNRTQRFNGMNGNLYLSWFRNR